MTYAEKLKDPRWQKKRLEIMQRDDWKCQSCFDNQTTLNVHHKFYISGHAPWDYENSILITLCESCHQAETERREDADARLPAVCSFANLSVNDVELLANSVLILAHIPRVYGKFLIQDFAKMALKCVEHHQNGGEGPSEKTDD